MTACMLSAEQPSNKIANFLARRRLGSIGNESVSEIIINETTV